MTEDSFAEFDPTLKKKKKKKAAPADILDDNKNGVEEVKKEVESLNLNNDQPPVDNNDVAITLDEFDPTVMKKKKRKKKEVAILDDADAEMDGGMHEDGVDLSAVNTWETSERDYTYEELLKRAMDKMREKNPEMQCGEKKKYVMRPPQVVRHGAKKTSFANFLEICKMLHRTPRHVQDFLMAELGTSGSVDGYNQLLIKGRFQQKNIEGVLKRYIREYVTCHTCRSADTLLQKDGRLHFLQCEACNSRCAVQSIKSGFQAVTGKRKTMRDKQG